MVKASKKKGLAHQVVELMDKLYKIERELKEQNAPPSLIFITRIQKAKPLLNQIKTRLDDMQLKIPSKSPLGTALFYALNHWEALNAYLYDGRLEIDNIALPTKI